jgi:pimeloyl-ACP methyl ester carboxylesterase
MFPAGDPAYRVSYPRLASGIRIRVVERGDANAARAVRPRLGLHCLRLQAKHACDRRRRIPRHCVRSEGHGLSDKPQTAFDYTIDVVEHMKDVLDALSLARPVLAGHSLGGTLVYHFASKYPARVRGLALISPAGMTGIPRMRIYRFLTPNALTPLSARQIPSDREGWADARLRKRGHFTRRDVEEYIAPSQFPDWWPAVRHLLHSYDWAAGRHRILRTVDLPAVGVWGTLDHMLPDGAMDIYSRLLPQIELHAIPDAGHVVAEETPLEVNETLVGLLRRVYFGK